MPEVRTYTDSTGVDWVVFRVEPQALSPTLERLRDTIPSLTHEHRRPWLLFESATGEKRRLVPVPDEWGKPDSDRLLADWWVSADPVPPAPEEGFADLKARRPS